MDWEVIYNWLEQKSGVSYDLNEDIESIKGDTVFTDTFYWVMRIGLILSDLDDVIDVIDANANELTEDMPSREDLKKAIEYDCLQKLTDIIDSVKKQLGMSIIPIKDDEDVIENAQAIAEMISMCSSFSLEELQKREWFDEYNEQTDYVLTETLELHKNDLVDIHQTIETIREGFNTDEDDDDDDMDMDMDEE